MIKLISIVLLAGCGPKLFKKEYITLSESACVDGTILNMDQAGCESFYWGTDPEGSTLKIRCTYAPEDSFWTRSSFYAYPHEYDLVSDLTFHCRDQYVKMYSSPAGIRLEHEAR